MFFLLSFSPKTSNFDVNVFVLFRRQQIDAQKTKENGKENKSIFFFFFVAGFEGKKVHCRHWEIKRLQTSQNN